MFETLSRIWRETRLGWRTKQQDEIAEGYEFGVSVNSFRCWTVWGGPWTVWGGPFSQNPGRDFVTICLDGNMAKQHAHDYFVPWPDFGIPNRDDLEPVIRAALRHARAGRAVYVGCMGGIGRTGTFLAIMAKEAGLRHPVHAVRRNYLGHAVETAEQESYVTAW